MAEWRIERLDRHHVRAGFECGKPSLDEFLRVLVSQYEKRGLGRSYVAVLPGDPHVLGFYTLASGDIDIASLPAKEAKKLPRHPVPVVLIARLAVIRTMQGQGLGGALLRDAMIRAVDIADTLGIHAVVVDTLDSEARAFYMKYGFAPLTDNEMRLFITMATIRAATKR